jgi:hypothetical protein
MANIPALGKLKGLNKNTKLAIGGAVVIGAIAIAAGIGLSGSPEKKFIGTWEPVNIHGQEDYIFDLYATVEFFEDGTFQEVTEKMDPPITRNGRYELLAGDRIEFDYSDEEEYVSYYEFKDARVYFWNIEFGEDPSFRDKTAYAKTK